MTGQGLNYVTTVARSCERIDGVFWFDVFAGREHSRNMARCFSASMSFPADRVCAVPSCRLQACLKSLEVLATVDVRLGIDPGALVGFERLRKVCGDCKGCRRCTAP